MDRAQPNILLLFTDQQRADTIAALGNPLIRTPVLDGLVRDGTSFNAAYTASPVCIPARHALVTGLPPHRTGVVDNVENAPPARSFIELLAGSGYTTHGVGKMHFCGDPRRSWGFESRDYAEELDPDDDYRRYLSGVGYGHVLDPHGLRSEYYYLPQPSQLPAPLHHTTWVADRSIDFLRKRDTRRPFFLWSSFIKPHPPFETPNPWGRLYRSSDMPDPVPDEPPGSHATFWTRLQNRYKYMDGGTNPHLARSQRAAYYATISFIDYHVGRILAALGPEAGNTLVVFTSDHGEMLGDFGCYGKRSMLDAAARVPLLVRRPGHFPAGASCNVPVSLLDLYPTFAAAAGVGEQPDAQSVDLARVLSPSTPARMVTSQFSQRALGLYMITDGAWKYIYSAADRREFLYHRSSDPQERIDRSTDPVSADELVRLRRELINRFTRDGYDWAVHDGSWRDYGIARLPAEPRSGLLRQDPPALAEALSNLTGYRVPAMPPSPDWLSASLPAAMDPATGRVAFSASN